jgi:hypothetical protein
MDSGSQAWICQYSGKQYERAVTELPKAFTDTSTSLPVSPPTRKIALLLVVVGFSLLAGCSAFTTTDDASTELLIANQDNTDRAVLIEISEGEDVVYSAGRTIDAETTADLKPFNGTGEYEVTLSVDGDSTTTTYEFTAEDAATTIGIDNDGTATIGE